jgi:hypothetical protein
MMHKITSDCFAKQHRFVFALNDLCIFCEVGADFTYSKILVIADKIWIRLGLNGVVCQKIKLLSL